MASAIPITIITGFLGSGKTTLILNLIPQLPKEYRLALLKNEFGDVAIDSQLASNQSITGVQELLNGCICCNLVGQLSDALSELRTLHSPDRIVIETSGSAFPATLAMEVNRLARETGNFVLDGVVSVVDVENWRGYEDKSVTAKLQAQYTDLIVLNKWELVSERQLESVEDRILDLELEVPTPREKSDKGWVSRDILLGLDAKLAKLDEVQEHQHHKEHDHDHHSEVEVLSVTLKSSGKVGVDVEKLTKLLKEASKDEIYRIKGVLYAVSVPTSSTGERASGAPNDSSKLSRYILNWAFGRWTFTHAPITQESFESTSSANSSNATPLGSGQQTPAAGVEEPTLRMTIVCASYESNKWKKSIETGEYITAEGTNREGSNLSVERIS